MLICVFLVSVSQSLCLQSHFYFLYHFRSVIRSATQKATFAFKSTTIRMSKSLSLAKTMGWGGTDGSGGFNNNYCSMYKFSKA